MSDESLIRELESSQALLQALIEDLDEISYREQYHPDLSPLGWHLGHCIYTECLWIHEVVRGDDSVTAPIADFYTPPRTPKSERGNRLPPRSDLLLWARELNDFNLHTLRNLKPELRNHHLFDNDYLTHFLIQHNSQHFETMLMILTQKNLAEYEPCGSPHTGFEPVEPSDDRIAFPAGHYRIGGQRPTAYDNEVPQQQAELGAFSISRYPASNAEFLGFIQDGGYKRRDLWCENGWNWLQAKHIDAPDHWRLSQTGHWHGVSFNGSYDLTADEPVFGINHYEASAFARWAGGQLPHEFQWEAACRIGLLENTGKVWEWCVNTFQPYAGFTPFPYEEYSSPWFDKLHFSLRGGSLHTRPAIKRPSFRNFFEADKRHIFAGLRLVY